MFLTVRLRDATLFFVFCHHPLQNQVTSNCAALCGLFFCFFLPPLFLCLLSLSQSHSLVSPTPSLSSTLSSIFNTFSTYIVFHTELTLRLFPHLLYPLLLESYFSALVISRSCPVSVLSSRSSVFGLRSSGFLVGKAPRCRRNRYVEMASFPSNFFASIQHLYLTAFFFLLFSLPTLASDHPWQKPPVLNFPAFGHSSCIAQVINRGRQFPPTFIPRVGVHPLILHSVFEPDLLEERCLFAFRLLFFNRGWPRISLSRKSI